MNDSSGGRPTEALEDVAFLTRSENRVEVLDALVADAYAPSELTEVTGASRPTLGRILHEFEERGWTERSDDGYAATPAGEYVLAEFAPFAGAMETIRRLGDAVAWLPSEELTIGLHHFRDATVRRPERNDPMDVVDLFTELFLEATELWGLTHLVPPEPKQEAMLDGVTSGRLDANLVLTDDLVCYLRDVPKRDAWFREFVAAGARVHRYDDSIPCNLFVIDDLVILGESHPESGHPYAFVESDDETVREWAKKLVADYRAEADRIVPEQSGADSATAEDSSAEETPVQTDRTP